MIVLVRFCDITNFSEWYYKTGVYSKTTPHIASFGIVGRCFVSMAFIFGSSVYRFLIPEKSHLSRLVNVQFSSHPEIKTSGCKCNNQVLLTVCNVHVHNSRCALKTGGVLTKS